MTKTQLSVLVASAMAIGTTALPAHAKVSAAEAAKLCKELTCVGAEKKGNADGTIPAYTGGLKAIPSGYKDGGPYVNPYGDEKPRLTIDKSNWTQHKDKLSAGHQKLFEKYDTYKMLVFPTHRPVKYPDAIEKATVANATTATLGGSDAIENAKLGFPFPIPQTGAEVIFNHKVRYRGQNVVRANDQAVVYPNGTINITKVTEEAYFSYGNIDEPGDIAKDNMLLYYLGEITSPAKSAGKFTLVHETANQVKQPRKAWIANKGSPRPRRAPNVSYDNPSDGTDGHAFNEQVDMYNGAQDRYTWKLVGKKEYFIPYNSYEAGDQKYKYRDLLPNNHMNPDAARYELHRVWVVEANLKPGISHSFSKRTFYVDEDSWGIALVDLYDKRGDLWRFQEGHTGYAYNVKAVGASPELIYDFNSGAYFATALTNEGKVNEYNVKHLSPKYFTTSGLKRKLR